MSFVITPQSPIADWLSDLDASLERSRGFFAGHPIALDLSAVQLAPSEIAQLVSKLEERKIRVLGIEGVEVSEGAERLPPILRGGRGSQDTAPPEPDSTADKPVKKKDRKSTRLNSSHSSISYAV